MYLKHGSEELPDDLDALIWRYMDFPKFVYMLESQSLFFCRPDYLDDRFEGTWGPASLQNIEQELTELVKKGRTVIGGVDRQLQGHKRSAALMRQCTAVNCWHLSQYESEAMWKLYIYAHQGIAVCSSVSKLIGSFPDDKALLVHVGKVKYIDFDTEPIPAGNLLTPFLYKRKSFEHERELRAVAGKAEITESDDSFSLKVLNEPFSKPGEDVAVDLSELIASIHLAPGSPAWMERLVASVASRYGLDVPVVRSKLDDEPV
jgi:hypothetical protein